jgi:large subunit ribosomal protein L14e
MKIAGRDAGKKCVVISAVEKGNLVMIDGETRRKKCNVAHLEPLKQTFKIKDKASHSEIVDLFKKELKITLKEKKSKPKTERPKKARKQKVKPEPKKPKKGKKAKAKAETKPKKETSKKAPAQKTE